jgi:hypothetical protein
VLLEHRLISRLGFPLSQRRPCQPAVCRRLATLRARSAFDAVESPAIRTMPVDIMRAARTVRPLDCRDIRQASSKINSMIVCVLSDQDVLEPLLPPYLGAALGERAHVLSALGTIVGHSPMLMALPGSVDFHLVTQGKICKG